MDPYTQSGAHASRARLSGGGSRRPRSCGERTFAHPELKGLPMTQTEATTQTAAQQYMSAALNSIVTSIRGSSAFPSVL